MRKIAIAFLLASVAVGNVFCAETIEKKAAKLVKSVEEGCKVEFTTFCKDVTPGEGRRLACLYAFEDKLSSQCEYALYDAASKLEQAVVKLQHVANSCSGDIDTYCKDVAMGEGRIMNCLRKNDKKLSAGCNQALKATEMK
jgi:hypothetical protein